MLMLFVMDEILALGSLNSAKLVYIKRFYQNLYYPSCSNFHDAVIAAKIHPWPTHSVVNQL